MYCFSGRIFLRQRHACIVLLALMALMAAPANALAHRVYIFAWAENDLICTESYYNKKTKVRNGTVFMRTEGGTLLAEKQSDAKGSACFTPPEEPQNLLFFVDAGQGHRGEFFLPASKGTQKTPSQNASQLTKEPPAAPQPETSVLPTSTQEQQHATASSAQRDTDALRSIIREELQAQLMPLQKSSAESSQKEPGWLEIFSGLGWIIALTSLALLYKQKKER